MTTSPASNQRGSGWFEFAVVLCIVAVLGATFYASLVRTEGQAERAAVDLRIDQLRAELRLLSARRMAAGKRESALPEALGMLAKAADDKSFDGWSFDRARGELVYRVRLGEALEPRLRELKWHVVEQDGAPHLIESVAYVWQGRSYGPRGMGVARVETAARP